jgi:hypothetical protein
MRPDELYDGLPRPSLLRKHGFPDGLGRPSYRF